ncbi:MAG: hypothetical protein II304_06045 [Bacteroidales bacterium]|nr:hypothetical protein [Bacteroidales bacterium]
MGSKNSWRLLFVDIDSSFSVSTESSTIKGYMVVRAPKGETSPYYFEKGNMSAIYAMIGVPTANWPDLYEAEAFNQEYGLYVSAPAGSSKKYPSYFGGAYITSKGLIDFYNVTGKDVIDYTQMVQVGFEDAQGYKKTNVNVIVNPKGVGGSSGYPMNGKIDGTKDNIALYITGIQAKQWASVQEIGINYWGDETSGFNEGTYYYSVNKTDHKLYIENEEGEVNTDYYCGIWVKAADGTYSVIIGGNSWILADSSLTSQTAVLDELENLGIKATSTNTYENTDAPLLTLTDLFSNIENLAANGGNKAPKWSEVVAYLESGNKLTVSNPAPEGDSSASADFDEEKLFNVEFIVTDSATGNKTAYTTASTYTSPVNRYQGITWLLNVKPYTYGYVVQKSAAEVETNVAISSIGYDKWLYDLAVPVIYGPKLKDVSRDLINGINFNNDDNLFLYCEISYDGSDPIMPEEKAVSKKLKLYQYNSEAEASLTTLAKTCTDVGEAYETQSLLIYGDYILNGIDSNGKPTSITDTNTTSLQIDHEILYVVSASNFQFEKEDDENYPLKKDINYNTMTFKVTEEVYPGEMMNGGEFTGSFNEKGKDSYGANIYWPNVLNDDDMTFIEIHPDKTFDEDLDSHGIYTGTRIVDDKLTYDLTGALVPTTYTLKLKGQRYVTHAVEQNIKDGTTGGSWRDEFQMVVKQGWTEAFDSQYDDVFIFMDPTGEEFVHTQHASLVMTHKLAIAISPKNITKAEFANPSKITVTGRSKQTAQFAGEFQYYDAYTGKSFWMKPIGDVGLMCARIYDFKMGGWPPAWYNYNDMGGQLPRAVLKARWNFSDTATKIMDEKGINPIIYNPDDGLMVTSSKTTQDPNNLTDWSYLEHVMSFVLLKRDIRDNVMRQQIKKPIDEYWMGIRQTQVEAILAKRTTGSNKIWTKAICDIAGVNNDITKAARKFIIYVKVKVTPFSEFVELQFENVSQVTNL